MKLAISVVDPRAKNTLGLFFLASIFRWFSWIPLFPLDSFIFIFTFVQPSSHLHRQSARQQQQHFELDLHRRSSLLFYYVFHAWIHKEFIHVWNYAARRLNHVFSNQKTRREIRGFHARTPVTPNLDPPLRFCHARHASLSCNTLTFTLLMTVTVLPCRRPVKILYRFPLPARRQTATTITTNDHNTFTVVHTDWTDSHCLPFLSMLAKFSNQIVGICRTKATTLHLFAFFLLFHLYIGNQK